MKEIIEVLDKILKVVVRVHSDNHPELIKIGELYTKLKTSLDNNDLKDAKEILEMMSKVSGGFKVPADACPTYEKTYNYLAKLKEIL